MITPSFTASQSGLAPGSVTLTDNSTGSDVSITQRRVYFQTTQGTFLVQDGTTTTYEPWSYADASKTFDVLNTDHALSITVQWLDVSNNILYTLTQVFAFPQYSKNFFYYLIQQQALTPGIIRDTVYFSNMATFWMNITGAIQAVEIGADIAASQACLDRATEMMENESKFF
jgi:hypothetical protein